MTDRPLLVAVFLGVVEGATEFLPVSSTGHLIVAGELLGQQGERAASFAIFIQIGAVLAVLWDRRALLAGEAGPRLRLASLVGLAFLPAALLGAAAHGFIKARLFSSTVVAWALLAGAVAILLVERRRSEPRVAHVDGIGPGRALAIGLFQCLALVPGTSRAMATILGAMLLGVSRPAATEFSFLLAVPTLAAAAGYDLLKTREAIVPEDLPYFATGLAVSFVVALGVVRWLLSYVRVHDFRPFAVWRAVLGAAVLLLAPDEGGPPVARRDPPRMPAAVAMAGPAERPCASSGGRAVSWPVLDLDSLRSWRQGPCPGSQHSAEDAPVDII